MFDSSRIRCPHKRQEYRVQKGPYRNRFDQFDQAPVQSFAPLHNVSHVTQTKERKFHVKIRSSADAVCHNGAHILTRMHACEKAGSYAVKSVTKSRGPIAISPEESPRLFFSLPFPSRPPRGRSLICNEPAPPVIILRLRDHVIIHTRVYRCVDFSRLILPETTDFQDGLKNLYSI